MTIELRLDKNPVFMSMGVAFSDFHTRCNGAVFSVQNLQTGKFMSFKMLKLENYSNRWAVHVLTGRKQWKWIGTVAEVLGTVHNPRKTTRLGFIPSVMSKNTTKAHEAFDWVFKRIQNNTWPDCMMILAAVPCARCGALLTNPDAIRNGIGHVCATRRF
jgi:hypothetical protein